METRFRAILASPRKGIYPMSRYSVFALLALLLLSACDPTIVAPPRSADYYFKEGEKFYEAQRYDDAVASWKKVRDSYYSPDLNKLAELKIAEAQYLSENFKEAESSYAAFLKEHPQDERLPDVLYFLGMSAYKQMLSKDRDQTATQTALDTFSRLVRDFPKDKRAEEVGFLIQRCRNRLGEHEVYVAQYYLRSGHPQAAVNRLEDLLAKFPNYFFRDEAYYYLGTAYLELQQRKNAADTFNRLFDEFPGSEYIIKSQKILEKNY